MKAVLALALTLIAATANAQNFGGIKPVKRAELVAHNKKLIGEATVLNHVQSYVTFTDTKFTKGSFTLFFERDRALGDRALHYVNADCTGEHGLTIGDFGSTYAVSHYVAIAPPGNTLYIMDRKPPVIRTIRSFWWEEFDFCQVLDDPYENEPLTPVVKLINIDDHIKFPVHIRPK